MRIFLDYIISLDNDNKEYIIEKEEDKRHILLVMRKTIGDFIEIVDLNKQAYKAEIVDVKPLAVKIDEKIMSTESNISVDIYQGLPKFDKMEYIIEKSVELGVREIYPIEMERSVVKLNQKEMLRKIDRWNKISKSASQQSKRNIIPEVKSIIKIKDIEFDKYDLNIFLDAEKSEENIKLNTLKEKDIKIISVIIGPEGGFSLEEKEYLFDKAKSINLGSRILRTETASIVILSLLQNIFGDFNA